MTPGDFRRIALSLPGTSEGAHMGHPDFRVKGRIFATLLPRKEDGVEWGMVKLKPEQQQQFVKQNLGTFEPVPGAWGRQGCTRVRLRNVDRATLRGAIVTAWSNTAPKRLLAQLGPPGTDGALGGKHPYADQSVPRPGDE